MKDLDSLDLFSYQCGVIDAFNEVVKAGVKRIALSHPVSTREEALSLVPFSEKSAHSTETIFTLMKARCSPTCFQFPSIKENSISSIIGKRRIFSFIFR